MRFELDLAVPVLARTPGVLRALLDGLPDEWIRATEGPETWSPFDVVGHLVHGERTDWLPRVEILLRHGESQAFPPFDRFAMLEASRGRTLDQLLEEFAALREAGLERLRALRLSEADLERPGRHPGLGRVTLDQHLATWVAHDLSHIGQIVRVMGRQYGDAVGPWLAFLPMLHMARPAGP
jgi:uncharacterized damage-inducible protein DinB